MWRVTWSLQRQALYTHAETHLSVVIQIDDTTGCVVRSDLVLFWKTRSSVVTPCAVAGREHMDAFDAKRFRRAVHVAGSSGLVCGCSAVVQINEKKKKNSTAIVTALPPYRKCKAGVGKFEHSRIKHLWYPEFIRQHTVVVQTHVERSFNPK